jgi:hypothetical protein
MHPGVKHNSPARKGDICVSPARQRWERDLKWRMSPEGDTRVSPLEGAFRSYPILYPALTRWAHTNVALTGSCGDARTTRL